MLISKLFYFFLYVYPVLKKNDKVWCHYLNFPNTLRKRFWPALSTWASYDVIWWSIAYFGRKSLGKSMMFWRPLCWLSVVIRLWHCVNWRGRLHSSVCWQSFWCSTNRPLKKCSSNLGPRKRQKSALARLLACFHPTTKILSIAVNPHIAANEM